MAKFDPGRVVVTSGIYAVIQENARFEAFIQKSLGRHISGDWGDLSDDDKELNDDALENEEDRIFSSYECKIKHDGPDNKIWIITEWDRSITTILFPSEY